MKEFKLSAWPELTPAHNRTAYRRMLNDMSHRYVGVQQLVEASGLPRAEVRHFLELLEASGVLHERDRGAGDSMFDSLRPLGGWLHRTLTGQPQRS
ncbi:MAG TPA: hypothetical protein VLU41_08135 [Ideonella sp.]|jgi:predicted transcriptional regulator|nr:hypothetical protein [Ideonella sp.]